MARGVNKVVLVGNLGNDPETKYTPGGTAVTSISLATTSTRKDRDGNQQERTEWHRVKFFGKLAEVAGEYLTKGSQVYVEGSIRYDKYTGQDGVERYTTDIIGNEMQMLGGQRDRDQRNDRDPPRRQQAQSNRPTQGRTSAQRPARSAPPPSQQDDYADGDFQDDNIPF